MRIFILLLICSGISSMLVENSYGQHSFYVASCQSKSEQIAARNGLKNPVLKISVWESAIHFQVCGHKQIKRSLVSRAVEKWTDVIFNTPEEYKALRSEFTCRDLSLKNDIIQKDFFVSKLEDLRKTHANQLATIRNQRNLSIQLLSDDQFSFRDVISTSIDRIRKKMSVVESMQNGDTSFQPENVLDKGQVRQRICQGGEIVHLPLEEIEELDLMTDTIFIPEIGFKSIMSIFHNKN